MDGVLALVGIIIKITFMGFVTFVILQVLRNMKKTTLREEISKVEAKLSALRMNLKTRVKRKAARFRATYPQPITEGDPIDTSINQLSNLPFEKNNDFQDYIDLCKKINNYIFMASMNKPAPSSEGEQKKVDNANADTADFMGDDFKNEIQIVRTISDMALVSRALSKQIYKFNHFDKRISIQPQEPINFPSMFELQRVFRDAPDESSAPAQAVPEKKSAAA